MRKLLLAVRTDLRVELKALSFLFFIFPLHFTFSQVPINGFCKLTTFKIDSGYNKIASLNYNGDAYSDLLIFNSTEKKALVLEGIEDGKFKSQKKISLTYPITNIESNSSTRNGFGNDVFTSRSEKLFGLLKFSPNASASFGNKLKFKSYPDKISVADIDEDNVAEVLISGSSFEGLSVISFQNGNISENIVAQAGSYKFSTFVDLNNDDKPDIAAYSSLTKNIHFFYNKGNGKFSELRQIPQSVSISQLKSFDFNLDYFQDLIVSGGKSITLYLGDVRSSYEKIITVDTKFKVDDFVIGDFNRDGYFDIVYLSISSGTISTIFGKPDAEFHEEVVHLIRRGLKFITPYFSKFIFGIAYLTESGELGIISQLKSFSDNFSIALSVKPGALSVFDKDNNGINDLAFIDESNNTLNLLIRNDDGRPDTYLSAKLFAGFKNIVADDRNPFLKRFYCFNYNERLIEIRIFNLNTNEVRREQLYSPGPIIDLKVNYSKKNSTSMNIAYSKNGELYFGEFSYSGVKYNIAEYPSVSRSWIDAEILQLENPLFIYWKIVGDSTKLFEVDFSQNKLIEKLASSFKGKYSNIYSAFYHERDNLAYRHLNLLFKDGEEVIQICRMNNQKIINLSKDVLQLRIKNKKHLSFGGINTLLFYDESEKELVLARADDQERTLKSKLVYDNIELEDFLVTRLDKKKYHLIYSDRKSGSLVIKQLPK